MWTFRREQILTNISEIEARFRLAETLRVARAFRSAFANQPVTRAKKQRSLCAIWARPGRNLAEQSQAAVSAVTRVEREAAEELWTSARVPRRPKNVRYYVSILSRRIPYDRKRLLGKAAALESGWRWRRALTLYMQVLAAEPRCAEVHGRVAPLLARSKRMNESWASYQIVIEANRETAEAIDSRKLLRSAVRALPYCAEASRELARVERELGRADASLRILEKGSRRLARRGRRGEAILLLRDAREIESWNPNVVIALGRLLIRDGRKSEALYFLDHLDEKVSSDHTRTVRFLIWRIEPSLRHTWRWLTAPRAPRPAKSATRSKGKAGRTTRSPLAFATSERSQPGVR